MEQNQNQQLNSPDMSEDEGGSSSDDSEAPNNEADHDHNLPQSPTIPSTSCSETSDKGDNSTSYVVCDLGEDENEDEVWIECKQCYKWVHESCLLHTQSHTHSLDIYSNSLFSVESCLKCCDVKGGGG